MGRRVGAGFGEPGFDKPEGGSQDWETLTRMGKRLRAKLGVKPQAPMRPDQIIDGG